MPLMGLLGGVGEGLAQTGQLMQKDALEERRMKRLEEAELRRTERANMEWDRRTDKTRGYALEDRDEGRAFEYGQQNLPTVQQEGAFNFKQGAEMDQWRAQTKVNQAHDFAKLDRTHSNAVALQREKAISEGGIAGLKDSDLRAIYDREMQHIEKGILPSGDVAQANVITAHGGYQNWAKKYQEVMQSKPSYLEWREIVFGIPNPGAGQTGGLLGSGAPGVSAPAATPPADQGYPEGTRLRGRDGKVYVVRDGVPVLAE